MELQRTCPGSLCWVGLALKLQWSGCTKRQLLAVWKRLCGHVDLAMTVVTDQLKGFDFNSGQSKSGNPNWRVASLNLNWEAQKYNWLQFSNILGSSM